MDTKIDIEALCAERGLRITEQRRVIARVLLVAAMILVGCSRQASGPATEAAGDGKDGSLQKITFIHDWYPEAVTSMTPSVREISDEAL